MTISVTGIGSISSNCKTPNELLDAAVSSSIVTNPIRINTVNGKIEIPVCCNDLFSLDIKRLEEKLSLNREKVYENFFGKEYFCYMTGFIAGMPFLGDLDKSMRVNRLETPRVKVPKGSVGITEQFTNIYTFESPGGWNIIGNTPQRIFDSGNKDKPIMINPGDEVSFFQISKNEYEKLNEK